MSRGWPPADRGLQGIKGVVVFTARLIQSRHSGVVSFAVDGPAAP